MSSVNRLPRGRLKERLFKRTNSGTLKSQPKSCTETKEACSEPASECKVIPESTVKSTDMLPDDQERESDSEASSVGDHLVDAEMINLDEPFFSPTFQSQTFTPPDSVSNSMQQNDSESSTDDSDSNEEIPTTHGEDERMYEIFSQLTDFEKKVKEANECRKQSETNISLTKKGHLHEIPSILTQSEEWLSQNVLNNADNEWENVTDQVLQTEGNDIEIIISNDSQKSGKVMDIGQSMKRLEQERRRKRYLGMHKTHLLLLLSLGIQVNSVTNHCMVQYASELYDLIGNSDLSMPEEVTLDYVKSIVRYYLDVVKLATKRSGKKTIEISKAVQSQLQSREASCRKMFNIMLMILLRFLSVRTRLVMNLDVVPKAPRVVKPVPQKKLLNPTPLPNTQERYGKVPLTTTEILKRKPEIQKIFQLSQLDGADDETSWDESLPVKRGRLEPAHDKPRLWKLKSLANPEATIVGKGDRESSSGGKSTQTQSKEEQQTVKLISSKYFRKKVASKQTPTSCKDVKTKTETPNIAGLLKRKAPKKQQVNHKQGPAPYIIPELDIWIECFLEKEHRWVVVEAGLGQIDCMEPVIDRILNPPVYVFAWEPDGTIVDVSQRYWWRNESNALKQRVDKKWLRKAIARYRPAIVDSAYLEDQKEFRQLKYRAPIPQSIGQFKNHPSYCLQKDLQKFQAIYPPDAPPLGFIQGHPIYARECVHTLHSREVWLRHAKVIRMHEQPYKIVKSKLRRVQINLELFGSWQTEDYIPPEPVDGIVPRNSYGNIELFKECMLPKGTVHLKQYGLSYICRKLGIDYSVAVVGFGLHPGGNHPVFDGIVICEEHQDRLLEAWERHQEEATQKKTEKKHQEVLKRWVKLVKGLLVRRRLQQKYNFDGV